VTPRVQDTAVRPKYKYENWTASTRNLSTGQHLISSDVARKLERTWKHSTLHYCVLLLWSLCPIVVVLICTGCQNVR
jgi:hypothetical protein